MSETKTQVVPFLLQGLVTKKDPVRLDPGQYPFLLNMDSWQEGSMSTRAGRRYLGQMVSETDSPYMVRKLRAYSGENPTSPSANPRYVGVVEGLVVDPNNDETHACIYRSRDYVNFSGLEDGLVAIDVDVSGHQVDLRWNMVEYSAGSSGSPWGYIASELKMLKDRGLDPYPAYQCDIVSNASNTSPIVITTQSTHNRSTNDVVTIFGVTGNRAANNRWKITKINNTSYSLSDPDTGNPSAGSGAYTGGGKSVSGGGLPRWGILPAAGVAEVAEGGAGSLDGGVSNPADPSGDSPAQSQPYDYLYTYVARDTGNEGNPSMEMLATGSSPPLAVHNKAIIVTVHGTSDEQVDLIGIYRRGGILYDTWRLVAYVQNPGENVATGKPLQTSYSDSVPDDELLNAKQIEFDNDPPVLSTMPSPFISTVAVGRGPGWQLVQLTDNAETAGVRAGSLIRFSGDNTGTTGQTAVIYSVNDDELIVYLQKTVQATDRVTIAAISGQPCYGAVQAFDSIFIYGDPNNPHILYKSKTGRPESFPLRTAGGIVNQIGVGTPSNDIMAATEFRGQIVCLNRSNLFEVPVVNGRMFTPSGPTPAKRGLAARYAWCKADNEIWYLAHDGIWSWDGGTSIKRTEAIDTIFHGRRMGDIYPIDMNPGQLQWASMEYVRNEIHLLYRDTAGVTRMLACNPTYGDRWLPRNCNWGPEEHPITVMYREPDTGSVIFGRQSGAPGGPDGAVFSIEDQVVDVSSEWATSDEYLGSSPGSTGAAIPYEFTTPWFDLGNPQVKKLIEEVWMDITPHTNPNAATPATVNVEIRYDYSTNATDHYKLPQLTGRQLVALLPKLTKTNTTVWQGYGEEVRAIQFRFWGQAYPYPITFHSLIFQYQETGLLTSGGPTDWDNLGTRYDKKLYQMRVIFDTEGTNHVLVLETMSGKDGKIFTAHEQEFVLSNPVVLGNGKCLKSFPIEEGVICKLVRVRPISSISSGDGSVSGTAGVASSLFFKIHSVDFEKEEFPPDIVSFTPDQDYGHEYDKYANQLDLEVDTGGVPVAAWLEADGAQKQQVTVTTTERDRRRNLTLSPNQTGKKWRVTVDPNQDSISKVDTITSASADTPIVITTSSPHGRLTGQRVYISGNSGANGSWYITVTDPTHYSLDGSVGSSVVTGGTATGFGKWQLFSWRLGWQPVDHGEVGHTFGWDDLGHPWDKRLHNVTLEWDASTGSAQPVTMQMDMLTGINGDTLQSDVAEFVLTANGYSKKEFPLPDGLICKMIRIYPKSPIPQDFTLRVWKYRVEKVDLPADISLFTEPKDFGWPYEKIARTLNLKVDTGGVPAEVDLVGDNDVKQTFSINTSIDDWRRVDATSKDLIAKLWKLRARPGVGGKFQLLDWDLNHVKEPPRITYWRSYEQTFNYPAWKAIKQMWIEYWAPEGLVVLIESDAGSYTKILPPHIWRATERFLLPSEFNGLANKEPGKSGNGLNKSKVYIITFGSAGIVGNDTISPSFQFGIVNPFVSDAVMTLNIPTRLSYRFNKLDWNISLDVGAMPTGQSAILQPQISSDRGASWREICTITITPAGLNYGTITSFVNNMASQGDWIRVKCLQAGSISPGRGIQALMYGSQVTAASGEEFKIYAGSKIEWIPLGADRHSGYQQTMISSFMEIAI